MDGERPLRSRASLFNALVMFVNRTMRVVTIYWVDYDGYFKKLITLKPGDHRSTNTFSTHPWVFKDATTGERMHVENSYVYWPKPLIYSDHEKLPRVKRRQIEIHFPMRSLRESSLWIIAKNLQQDEDIKELELPNTLSSDLAGIFIEYERYKRNSKYL